MTTLSTHALSLLTAVQGADAAGTGSVLYDSGVAGGSEAALVETFLTDPKALPEAVQIRAQMLMGKLRLGRWTAAGDIKLFDNPQTAMQAARAALKKAGPAVQSFVGESAVVVPGEFGQRRADGRCLHVAEEEAARGEVVMGVPFLEGARLAVGKPVYWMAQRGVRSGKMSDGEWEAFGEKLDRTLGPVFSKLDSPPASFKDPAVRGSSARVDDATLAAALARHEGNQLQTGKELGQPSWWVSRCVLASKPGSPLWRFRKIDRRRGNPPRVDDTTLAQALAKHGGNRTHAGREVGLAQGSVSGRVLKASPGSPLARFKGIKGKPTVDDATLAQVLARHQGNRSATAREVGVTAGAVEHRIERAKEGSPLMPFREVRGTPGPKKRIDDAALAEALAKHQGNRTRAAKEVGLSNSTIAHQISAAEEGSPLRVFKGVRGTKKRVDDAALAAALARHEGNRTRAGQEVGLSAPTVSQRVLAAKPNSPLAPYQELKGKRGRPSKTTPSRPEPVEPAEPGPAVGEPEALPLSISDPLPAPPRAARPAPTPPKPVRSGNHQDHFFEHLDEEIAGNLKRGLSLKDAAAYDGWTTPSGIRFRLEAAPDGSPIAPFASQWKVRRVTDQQIVAELAKGKSIRLASQTLRIPHDVIEERLFTIRDTPRWGKNSPLVPFVHLLDQPL